MASKKTAKKSKTAKKKPKKKAAKKNSLVANIYRKRAQGTSRKKSASTVSSEAYAGLTSNWGKKRAKKKTAKKTKKKRAKKQATSAGRGG